MRYFARIEYNGSDFSGWQRQKDDVRTVQECLENALSKVANESISVITAGRTDAGVHATHQIIHFDTNVHRTELSWCRGTNRFMDRDVRIHWVCMVNEESHARFGALNRTYRYVIRNSSVTSALFCNLATHESRDLDVNSMALAANRLIGEHDFSSFRAAACQAHSPVRIVQSVSISKNREWVWLDIKANAFLQHMVRNIAGALIEVGYGKHDPLWFNELLDVQDRTKGGVTAPPNGLYLVGVEYPEEISVPSSMKLVSFWD